MFLPVKTASKCIQTYHFGHKDDFFFWGGVQPFHNTPFPSAPTAPRNLLTEMLNTPLQPRLVGRIMFSACPFVCRLRKCEHDVLNTHRVRLHLAASLLHLLCNQKLHRRLVQPIGLVDRLSVFKKSLSDDFFFSQGDFWSCWQMIRWCLSPLSRSIDLLPAEKRTVVEYCSGNDSLPVSSCDL